MDPAAQESVFTHWLEAHAAILHHVANGFAGGADRHDLMQELMLALWRAVPAFKGGARPSTFIYRVACNAALMWRRSESGYRRRVDRFGAEVEVTAPANEPRSARDREMVELMYAEIRELPPIDRSLLLLHLDELGYAEMAEIVGLSESAVGTRLTRVKQRLISNLKEKTHELR